MVTRLKVRAFPAAIWIAMIAIIAAAGFLAIGPVSGQESADGLPSDIEDQEPVDINRASLKDLLEIPGMDPDLARAILAWRAEAGPFDSVDALFGSASITPARLLAVAPWLTAERTKRPFLFDVSATARSASTPPLRRETKFSAGRVKWHTAFRAKRGLPDSEDESSSTLLSGVVRMRPSRRLTLSIGDLAPIEGFGILLGISGRPAPAGALAFPAAAAWHAVRDEDIRLGAPAPDGRFLRGAAAAFGRHAVAGVFEYHAGATAPTAGDRVLGPARVGIFGAQVGGDGEASTPRAAASPGPRAGGPVPPRAPSAAVPRSLSARAIINDGRFWFGTLAQFPVAGGRFAVEAARDPENRCRYAVAAEARAARRFQFRLSRISGSRHFVDPLSRDSGHAPIPGELLDTGSNENREETAFTARIVPLRRMAVEFEVRGAVDPATSRRAWDRAVGTGIVRFEASPGDGWSLAAESRVETRGSPGPSSAADPPVRRHSAKLVTGWQKGRAHLRLEWQGRVDFEVPGSGATMAALGRVQDLVAARARWPLTRNIWIGAGVANYRLPSDAPAVLYEERPAGLAPAVFVRGTEQRIHLAAGGAFSVIEAGAFVAQRRATFSSDGADLSWGAMVRMRNGR